MDPIVLSALIGGGSSLLGGLFGKLFGGGGSAPKLPAPKENFETNQIPIPNMMSGGGIQQAPQVNGDPTAWKMAISKYLGR